MASFQDKNFELVPMEAPPMPRWVPGKLSFTLGEVGERLKLAVVNRKRCTNSLDPIQGGHT